MIDRDFQRMLDLGGNVYFLSKIFASDGLSYVQAVSTMTDTDGRGVPGDDARRWSQPGRLAEQEREAS